MSGDLQHDVYQFHEKFGLLLSTRPTHLTQRKLIERIECLQEELDEFIKACGVERIEPNADREREKNYKVVDSQDIAGQADALVDLVYFALGTAVMMGLPFRALWDDVQRANMAKVRGVTQRGHKVDVKKPEGWVGPQTMKVLEAHGYDSVRQVSDPRLPGGFELDDPQNP